MDYGWSYSGAAEESDIAHVETLTSLRLPEGLKRLSRKHDGATPYLRPAFWYKDSSKPNGKVLNAFGFAAFTKRSGRGATVAELNEFYRDRLPDMLVFGTDPYGCPLALDYSEGTTPSVVYVDTRDAEEDRVYRVAPTFDEFLDGLESQPEPTHDQLAFIEATARMNTGTAKWDEDGRLVDPPPPGPR